jgi:hypothetical protein
VRHTDSIHAERETLRDVSAILSHLEIQLELVSYGYQFALRDESRPLRVAHFDSQLSSILLRGCRESGEARHRQNPDDSSNERVHHFVKCRENLNAAHPIAKVDRGAQTHNKNTANLQVALLSRRRGAI